MQTGGNGVREVNLSFVLASQGKRIGNGTSRGLGKVRGNQNPIEADTLLLWRKHCGDAHKISSRGTETPYLAGESAGINQTTVWMSRLRSTTSSGCTRRNVSTMWQFQQTG